MLFRLGRGLQIAGMLILPIGMVGNIVQKDMISVQMSLVWAGIGVTIFAIGWLLQEAGRRR